MLDKYEIARRARFHESYMPEPNSGCWLWDGTPGPRGYGLVSMGTGRMMLAHRYSWHLHFGDPGALHVLHHCDVPCCVNPGHLFLGDDKANVDDAMSKGRMVCQIPGYMSAAARKSVEFLAANPQFVPRGERHGMSRLTEAAVSEILGSEESRADLALRFGVTRRCIQFVQERVTWKHVPIPSEAALRRAAG